MSLANINGALITAYQAAALGLGTAYEGKDYQPTPGTAYAAVWNLPAAADVDTLGSGGQDKHVGVFQVDINVPENTGTAVLLQHAQTLRAYFYAGRTVSYGGQDVRITKAERSSIRRNGGYMTLSVSVTYWAWTARP